MASEILQGRESVPGVRPLGGGGGGAMGSWGLGLGRSRALGFCSERVTG